MRMNIKLVFFILVTIVVLLEAKLNFMGHLAFSQKAILDYLFPKDLGIMRVRKPEEIQTLVNNVTTLDFIGLVERYGYSTEEHYIITEDGYNLVLHRISGSPLSKNQQGKKVVYLQPGILCTSDCWVTIGAGKDLPFLLADQGYDVWVGNFRGNSYCRSHVKMSPRNWDFWQFSFHEIGITDVPTIIDYILSYTKQKTLYYIGHSMGTTTLFILLSIRPEYNAKIKLGICLAPVALWEEVPPVVKHFLNNNKIPKFKEFLDFNNIYELAPLSSMSVTTGRILCAKEAVTQAVCIAIMFLVSGASPTQFNTTALPEVLSHYPAGASSKTLYHYYQNVIAKNFQAYDYGYINNYKQYGQATPITYEFEKITAPLALFYSDNDLIAQKANVFKLYESLPSAFLLENVPHQLFNHFDFLFAIDAKTLLYDRLIELLQEFDKQSAKLN